MTDQCTVGFLCIYRCAYEKCNIMWCVCVCVCVCVCALMGVGGWVYVVSILFT